MKAFLIILAAFALVGCQSSKPKRAITIASPDVAVVKAPIEKARQATVKASERVETARFAVVRSQAIVATLAPSPAQVPAVEQLKMELVSADSELTYAREQLNAVTISLGDANARADTLQQDVDKLRDIGIAEQLRADKAVDALSKSEAARAKTQSAYHRIKFYVATLLAFIAGYLGFALSGLLINPLYRLGVSAAAAALVFALIWTIL